MNLRRETEVSLGMGDSPNPIQIDPGNFGYFQSQPEAQCDPIAQRFPQFALTPSQGLMPGPNSLQPGYSTPIGGVVLDDFVGGHLHRDVKEVCKHKNSLLQTGGRSRVAGVGGLIKILAYLRAVHSQNRASCP